MVLVVNGVLQEDIPTDSRSLYAAYPMYRETAAQFHSMPAKLVGPMGLLYVKQREMAATLPHDKNVSIIGSDDMTTCIIVVMRHSGSGAAALAHLDGAGTEDAAAAMVQRVNELALGFPEGRLELQLVGGYSDPRNYSEELFCNILSAFHKQPVEIDLTLCCVGELNTTVRGGIHWPVIYGIGLNVKTGEIFPATFPDKGPDQALRSARHFTGGQQVLDVYDCTLGLLRIGPFNYEPLRGVDLWLAQSDQFILQHLSTSPEVEPPHFVSQETPHGTRIVLAMLNEKQQHYKSLILHWIQRHTMLGTLSIKCKVGLTVRATLKYIQDNQFPAVTVFRDNRPHYYRRDEATGVWQPIRY